MLRGKTMGLFGCSPRHSKTHAYTGMENLPAQVGLWKVCLVAV
uniref:Uncharacterized protein n=1 Tax=Arundo donax TaxID=35708 RepID=A0A0A9H2Y3_ARUDO